MIREVSLHAFKCFDDRRIPIAPLTLLTGLNAAGKSTVLQALLFLQQALTEGGRDATSGRVVVPLNGSILRLGAVKDVVDKVKGGSAFAIRLESESCSVRVDFRASDSGGRDDLSLIVDQVSWKDPATGLDHSDQQDLLPAPLANIPQAQALFAALTRLRYVPADRVGPAETYPLDNRERHHSLGARGERAVGALFWQREQEETRVDIRDGHHRTTIYGGSDYASA